MWLAFLDAQVTEAIVQEELRDLVATYNVPGFISVDRIPLGGGGTTPLDHHFLHHVLLASGGEELQCKHQLCLCACLSEVVHSRKLVM
jgi:hypothetical protein